MRISVEIVVSGVSFEELLKKAEVQWRIISEDPNGTIPDNAEVLIHNTETSNFPNSTNETTASVIIKTKVEANGTIEITE